MNSSLYVDAMTISRFLIDSPKRMKIKKFFQVGPVLRMSIGVVSLATALILVSDAFLHILPNERKQQAEIRRQVSTVIGSQLNTLIAQGDIPSLQDSLSQLVKATPEALSIGIRQGDTLVAASPKHDEYWSSTWTGVSTLTHIVVPLYTGKTRWGGIEVRFAEADSDTLWGWLTQPSVMIIMLLSTVGLAGVYMYLKRALHYLDPSHVVPQRVRKAFDTLTEGVLILDKSGRIMLANGVFHQMNAGNPDERVEGESVTDMKWLIKGLSKDAVPVRYPWDVVLHSNQTIQGKEVKVVLPDGSSHELMMNCSAINDSTGAVRGCLVTFDDVTQLSEANAMLHKTLYDLQISRDKIQQQNEELQKIAHFDPLTGCLNRRAFFSRGEPLYQKAVENGSDFICIIGDIDFFKSFNDRYGHAVGDLVIQQVSAALGRSLRETDLLCRYGGEEFCIVLPDVSENTGKEVADRIRSRIEKECGPGVRTIKGLRVTASFGFASLKNIKDCQSLSSLIELADEALYSAKKGGRNRVTTTTGEVISSGEPPQPSSEPVASGEVAH